ncbi:MAG: pantoate--beta-alanine ligase [Planctomycetes bacterium]|nr:pantoate--beta-alanine ligase [Planctomycetota bacterium]
MDIVRTVAEVRTAVAAARKAGRAIGFVPTMGALHAGHISLVDAAKADGTFVVVSIYVNPTQFGPNEDFTQYPRTFDADSAACRAAGVDLIFAPTNAEMYPPGDQSRVRPGPLAEPLCGAFRPGHFEGVCTVVAKLFGIVQPDIAYFGRKDFQQARVIEQMVDDLRMPVRIATCPIVREPDGLAMSSRNARLTPSDRARSLCLYQALCIARDRLGAGETSTGRIVAAMRAHIAAHADIKVDYLSLVDPRTLESATLPAPRVLVAGAIRVGDVRLIDNLTVGIDG